MAIDGDSFEAAITNTLKGSEPKAAVEVKESIEEAWKELSTEEQAAFRRSAEVRWPFEVPTRLPGETKATWHLRTEQAELDRQKVLDSAQLEAYKRSQTPHKLQTLVGGMAADVKEQAAALRQAAAAKAEEDKRVQDNQRKAFEHDRGSGLGGWSQA